ncbi:MAG: hypothetical protein WCP68_00810 [Enhydrobacter sp.]
MFPEFCLEHPTDHREIIIGRWSYLLAGLAGPLYAWSRAGSRGLARSLSVSASLLIALIVTSGITSYISYPAQFLCLVVAVGVAGCIQARETVAIVQHAYMERGWSTHSL